ncbi:MAG TPA: alpha/beta hydrolase [Desulfobulbaceae bacterium]|nr:alpha/beta hydrolase [Desulfobulbaceae bacterium]
MKPNILDRPDILQVLFHPRTITRTPLPRKARDIDIKITPEVTIGCRMFMAGKEAPIIIFFHGNGEIVADYDTIGPFYQQLDLNFLITDFRGYGWSTGSPAASTLLADARILYEQLKKRLRVSGNNGSIFIMGRSLGCTCAIDLAALHNDEIHGLIIDSGFAETIPLARSLGLDPERLGITEESAFNNSGKIATVTKPTFLLHGREDQLIPLVEGEKLMVASGARSKEFQVIPGADHNSLIAVGGMLYFQAIKKFIDKVEGVSDWRRRRKAFKDGRQKKQEDTNGR